mmetsp:Transcript_32951/g.79711  ORF Transcript_32951/g.79711 Transcript_32951/m.79711 type:complete len:706 (+) Transcript_32951:161-2278(+)|eukprot:CAMPEP_0113618656 /NCGR_PEP_ID=MMETSP0017_2-20120614/9454_1 /TAXON_ID=2856 /ORGANISM="Cylindrotheca closterium" /LENGTH=705 /DNA_ID=CAMNT_0000528181 /DNA_START=171 /DNA_END=2288 /DNA_ORIENTATION=- /assembly_acc=CAM_ASM_000147
MSTPAAPKPSNAAITAAAHGVSSIITWVIQKKTPTSTIGLTFRSRNKRVVIDKVRGRASRKTDLVPGLRVLKVCGHDVSSASECVKYIHAAPTGGIFIVTEGKHRAATKKSKKEKAGISIQKWPNQNYVQIARVNPVGMFRDLQVGQVLFIINGNKINNVMQALRLLRKKRKLRIVTVDVRTAVDPFDLIGENDNGGGKDSGDTELGATEAEDAKDDDDSEEEERAAVDNIDDDDSAKFSNSDAGSNMSSSNWDGQSAGGSTAASQWSSVYGEDKHPDEEEDGMLPTGFMNDMAHLMPGEIQMVTTKVIASVIKAQKDAKLGIKFSLKFDQHYVEKIEKDGLFANCNELSIGQRLVNVKGSNIRSASVEDALREAKIATGRITLETTDGDFGESDEVANNLKERLIIHFEKPREKGRLGVGFQKKPDTEGIGIVGISKEGFLAELNILAVGDQVIGINGNPCPGSTEELVSQIVAAEGMFSLELSPVRRDVEYKTKKQERDMKDLKRKEIEVLTPELGPAVVAEVEKPARDCKVGISLRKSLKIDSILIAAIADDGLLKDSNLRVGQKIVSINNTPCPTNTISAIKLIKGTPPGPLRLEACEVDWSATLAKNNPNPEGEAAAAPAAPSPAPEAAAAAAAPEEAPAAKEPEEPADEMQGMLDDFEAQLQNAYNDLNLDYDSADSSAVGDDQSFATGFASTYIEHGK